MKQSEIIKTQQDLLTEVKKEGEKFGEDVKHLADFASSQKKFTPWIEKAEEKKAKGLKKPSNLNEAIELLADSKVSSSISELILFSPFISPELES